MPADITGSPVALTIRIAFAGPRTEVSEQVRTALRQALQLAAEASHAVGATPVFTGASECVESAYANVRGAGSSGTQATLLVGHAPGTDQAAIEVWRELRLGPVHAVFPFADPVEPDAFAWTDDPANGDPNTRVQLMLPSDGAAHFDEVTVIDGHASLHQAQPRSPHLEQSRWLVRWGDVLVVVWNGEASAGPGGTANSVALALAKGIPVVWIDVSSDDCTIRVLSPRSLDIPVDLQDLLDASRGRTARNSIAPLANIQECHALLLDSLAPPRGPDRGDGSDEETVSRRDYSAGDPLAIGESRGLRSMLSRPHRVVRAKIVSMLAGAWIAAFCALATPSGAEQVSRSARMSAATDSSPGYKLIRAAFDEADRLATQFGNLHRAVQSALLCLAACAVMVGTSPAVWPAIKYAAVAIELILVFSAFLVWRISFIATNHRRWSDCRRLAERLRALQATWPLGFDIGDIAAGPARSWTEWQARAVNRMAGPPTGLLSAKRRAEDIAAARDDPCGIALGQVHHHALTAARMKALHRLLQRIETWTFWLLTLMLAMFLLLYHVVHDYPVIGGLLLMFSAVIPTIAAVCLAFDAKVGVEETAWRSMRLVHEYAYLSNAMSKADGVDHGERLLREIARIHVSDADTWGEAAVRRRIATI